MIQTLGRYLNEVHTCWGRWPGGTSKAHESTEKLRGCDNDNGGKGWVLKSEHFEEAI